MGVLLVPLYALIEEGTKYREMKRNRNERSSTANNRGQT